MRLKDLISKNNHFKKVFKNIDIGLLNSIVCGISSNSKNISKDYIFVAIKGETFDGLNYIEEAKKNGALLTLAEGFEDKNVFSLKEGSSRLIYSLLLGYFYENQPKQIIGVTGTNGKTSVVEFCRQIWAQAGWRAASMGTLGTKLETTTKIDTYQKTKNSLTTYEPSDLHKELENLFSKNVSHVAIEASSHGIDQYRLDGVRLSGAVFTNLSHEHLDYHKDIMSYFSAKKRLFTNVLKNNSSIAINIDDDYGKKLFEELRESKKLILTFGQDLNADIKINLITQNKKSIDLVVEFKNKTYSSTLGMIGKFQVYNVVASASICISLGMDPNFVFKSLSYLKPARGRMEIISGNMSNSLVIIDYAHSPEALSSVLKSLKENAHGSIITVFGCGGNRDEDKRQVMGKIADENSDIVIITNDNPRNESPSKIRKEILLGCPTAFEIPDRNDAIKFAVSKLQKNDFLLIAGKGHEMIQTIGTESLPFDDYTVAKEAIKNIDEVRTTN